MICANGQGPPIRSQSNLPVCAVHGASLGCYLLNGKYVLVLKGKDFKKLTHKYKCNSG